MKQRNVSIPMLKVMKQRNEKIICLSCYNYSIGIVLDRAEVDMVVVGDSVGMVELGYDTTMPVVMDEIIHHAKAVVKACKYPLVIGDMPFGSYNVSEEQAIVNANRLMKEAGVDAVSLEGGNSVAKTIKAIIKAGIPVMGHIGLTPQTISQLGGYKVQGKSFSEAKELIDTSIMLEEIGVFALELECIPWVVSKTISEKLKIPTIGIGSGANCDGQGLVINDVLGLYDKPPKFAKRYVNLSEIIFDSIQKYIKEVKEGSFPNSEHSFEMSDNKELTSFKTFYK